MLTALMTLSCTDELAEPSVSGGNASDQGIGQMVLFSAGNVGNVSATTRADVAPYMETRGRFVCTMYYHGNAGATDASLFDVEDENSRATSYLKVFDVHKPSATGTESLGNSVYWSRNYSALTGDDLSETTYTTYGFDPRVEPFYWKNRLPHVFVAYTDYNKLENIEYLTTTKEGETVPAQGALFMYPEADGVRKVKTGERVEWVPQKATVFAFKRNTMTLDEYNEANNVELTVVAFNALPDDQKYKVPASWTLAEVKENQSPVNWSHSRLVFDDAYHSSDFATWLGNAKIDIENAIDASELAYDKKSALKADLARNTPTDDEPTVNGTFHNSCWAVAFDRTKNLGYIDETEGNRGTKIDLSDPLTTVYFSYEKKNTEEIFEEHPANTFDLRRKEGMTSMADQPDPILAVTKMKPTGATQEANRVRLYFKHQFSQIQVNVQKVEGNTDDLTAESIESVELLGVSETGYVFTLPTQNGEAIAPAFDNVDVSKLTAAQLAENPYKTSFNMFQMSDAEKPTTSLRSFNAIAYGLLQALRITWKEPLPAEESDESKRIVHSVIFPITTDEHGNDLKTLQSGKRYLYDIRLARGMLASIRVSIQGWGLDKDLNYQEDGIISE